MSAVSKLSSVIWNTEHVSLRERGGRQSVTRMNKTKHEIDTFYTGAFLIKFALIKTKIKQHWSYHRTYGGRWFRCLRTFWQNLSHKNLSLRTIYTISQRSICIASEYVILHWNYINQLHFNTNIRQVLNNYCLNGHMIYKDMLLLNGTMIIQNQQYNCKQLVFLVLIVNQILIKKPHINLFYYD